jgi:hypothetical protein
MIVQEIEILLDKHWQWLKDKTIVKQIGSQWVEITTPYLDRHNDCLQIYARKYDNGFELTDDGYIISDLINSGCSLELPKRKEILRSTLAGFGVQINNDLLSVHATSESFPLKKHNIIQAMLAVNDLFYLASPHIENLFLEDVTEWLDLSDIRYTPNIKFTGRSGYDHMFNFVIPKSRNKPERIIQTLSNPQKDYAESLVFKWLDTKEIRTDRSNLFVLLNYNNSKVSSSVIDALVNYNLKPVLWSEREKAKGELAA